MKLTGLNSFHLLLILDKQKKLQYFLYKRNLVTNQVFAWKIKFSLNKDDLIGNMKLTEKLIMRTPIESVSVIISNLDLTDKRFESTNHGKHVKQQV